MAYTAFDITVPTSAQTGTALPASVLANLLALRDGIICGRIAGWTASIVVSGGSAEEPQYRVWSNSTYRIRGTYTFTSGYVTAVTWEYSTDSGSTPNSTGTWSTMQSETATYDGSNNATGGNNSGLVSWMYELFGKFKAHRALTGASAHGLGTVSTQSAAAVALTGGTAAALAITGSTIDSTTIGATTQAIGNFLQAREVHSSVAFVSGTNTLSWITAGSFSFTATGSGAATLTGSNFPASGIAASIVVSITNGGLRTWTWTNVKWAAGTAPTLSSSGRDTLTFFTRDGGTTIDGGIWAKGLA